MMSTNIITVYLCLFLPTVMTDGVCPGAQVPCAGTCTQRLSQIVDHGQAAIMCRGYGKRTYMGSRTNEVLEDTCSDVVGEYETQYVWSRYKLSGGLIVDEVGLTVDVLNWGIKYCGGVDQFGDFMANPCSWTKYAICVSTMPQYDKDHMQTCQNEHYWVSDRTDLTYDRAASFCTQNNMELATPFTPSRRACFSTVLRSRGFDNAWINYQITGATQSISPWDKEYCIKVNIANEYMLDRCEAQLPAVCSTFGELVVTDAVVKSGDQATLTCKCYNCSINEIKWTDGMTTWRVGERVGEVSVSGSTNTGSVLSTLTLSTVSLDQAFTCIQTTPFSDSVIYKTAKVDVYSLDVTSHYVVYGSRITITCDFNNDKHLDIDRVEWVDERDSSDISSTSKVSYKGSSAISTLEILSERYSHDVRCTFHTRSEGGGAVRYSGVSRIIVYKIEGSDVSVPSDTSTTLACDLKEHAGRNIPLVPPTRIDWLQGRTFSLPSQHVDPYQALITQEMRSGVNTYTCRFLFTNGDRLSKTLTVTAFEFGGTPDVVANGTTATLQCQYSKGNPPQETVWWEREGVRLKSGDKHQKQKYTIRSTFAKDAFYTETTELTVENAQDSATYQCGVRVTGNTWKTDVPLTVYLNHFIAPNITIVEKQVENQETLVVVCSVWGNPSPTLQFFINDVLQEGIQSTIGNMTSVETIVDQTCDPYLYKCIGSSSEGVRETLLESALNKKCGFFAKISMTTWFIIGGVIAFLILLIILICCCCCCCCRKKKTKNIKKGGEVEYQREVLNQADGASSLYALSRTESKVRGQRPHYEDMYSESGTAANYDPLMRDSNYQPLQEEEVRYDEPLSESGPLSPRYLRHITPLSPKYHRIESDYEPSAAPLFSSRSRSRENIPRDNGLFSPPLSRPAVSLSYQNLREQPLQRGFPQADEHPQKMNPFGNVQKYQNNDDASSVIPPSEVSDHYGNVAPPMAILSPKGWEIPSDPGSLFSPPTGRRPKKTFDPGTVDPPSPWQEANEKVRNWNLPKDDDGPNSWNSHPSMTGESSATLDTISITPKFGGGSVALPISAAHPEDRVGYASSSAAPSTVGPSASQYQPSVIDVPASRQNVPYEEFDIDDLSCVDVPDNGMDTLDRRIRRSHKNLAAKPALPTTHEETFKGGLSSGSSGSTLSAGKQPGHQPHRGAIKVLPTLPRDQIANLRTSNF